MTYIDILRQQLVRDLVFIQYIVVDAGSGKGAT